MSHRIWNRIMYYVVTSRNCYIFQLFKGALYHCEGPDLSDVSNKTDCHNKGPAYRWVNRKYNFDNLGQVSGKFTNIICV